MNVQIIKVDDIDFFIYYKNTFLKEKIPGFKKILTDIDDFNKKIINNNDKTVYLLYVDNYYDLKKINFLKEKDNINIRLFLNKKIKKYDSILKGINIINTYDIFIKNNRVLMKKIGNNEEYDINNTIYKNFLLKYKLKNINDRYNTNTR